MLRMVGDYLEQHNMRVISASGRQEMARLFAAGGPDLVVLDLRLDQEEAACTIHRGGRNAGSSASQRGQHTTRIAADLPWYDRARYSSGRRFNWRFGRAAARRLRSWRWRHRDPRLCNCSWVVKPCSMSSDGSGTAGAGRGPLGAECGLSGRCEAPGGRGTQKARDSHGTAGPRPARKPAWHRVSPRQRAPSKATVIR
jgi:hypothetical protein